MAVARERTHKAGTIFVNVVRATFHMRLLTLT